MLFLILERRCCEKLGVVFNNGDYIVDGPHEFDRELVWIGVTLRRCWVRDEEGIDAYDVKCALENFKAMDMKELRRLVESVIEALNDCLELALATSAPFLFPTYVPIALNCTPSYASEISIRIAWIRRDASVSTKMLLFHMLPRLCRIEVMRLESPVAPTIDDIAKLCSKTCRVEPFLNGVIVVQLSA